MKAFTFEGKENINYTSIDDAVIIHPTDVIVQVTLCAICGSDLHVFHEREKGIDHGTAMGHEFAGEVVEVGSSIKKLKVGDMVMSPFTTSCGNCYYCSIGLTCRCINGQLFGWRENKKGLHGAQAEFVRVPLADSTLMKIPEGINQEEAVMLGDIIPTGFFCALQSDIAPKGIYAVVGCGPVGLMAILGARMLGAENIFALDREPNRLEHAKSFGAIPIDTSQEAHLEPLWQLTDGRGADGVMEAVGLFATNRIAFNILRPGGILSAVGVCTDPHLSFSPADAYNKNITYRVGRCPARHLMDKLVPELQQKKFDFTSIITHRLRLHEGATGYEIFSNRKENCLKVFLKP